MPDDRACSSLHLHGEWSLLRMAGGQCPPKGGQLTTTTLLGQLVNPLTTSLTIDHHHLSAVSHIWHDANNLRVVSMIQFNYTQANKRPAPPQNLLLLFFLPSWQLTAAYLPQQHFHSISPLRVPWGYARRRAVCLV
jgi:hypothetical protein